ncbi:MAG: T9SS type A sorting domain-containing protein [Bacteroidota bacterium]
MRNISRKLTFTTIFSFLLATQFYAQCIADTEITTDGNGTDVVLTCPRDGRSDLVIFQSNIGNAETEYVFIITNENDIILDYRQNPYLNFERVTFSPLRVYGMSFSGGLTLRRGAKLFSTELATECFEISKNFISIEKSIPEAGTISTMQGLQAVNFCPGDPSNRVRFQNTNAISDSYAYAIVDTEGQIVGVTKSDVLDFSQMEAGMYEVVGIAYRGNLLDIVGDNIDVNYLSDACFSLSSNRVEVRLEELSAGTITASAEGEVLEACTLDVPLSFSTTEAPNSSYTYLVVDEQDEIAAIVAPDATLEMGNLPFGNYRVTGLAYTRSLTAAVGDNINSGDLSIGCHEFSENTIQLQKTALAATKITTTDGAETVDFCENNTFSLAYESVDYAQTAYVVTDVNQNIISVSESAEVTVEIENAQIYGIAYTGTLNLAVGDVLNTKAASDACYQISDNALEVNKVELDGGNLALMSGGDYFFACPEATGQLLLEATHQNSTGNLYTYLLLDDADIVQEISETGNFSFSEALTGEFSILGVAHLLPLSISLGDAFSTDYSLSTECYDLSDNRIKVVWQEPSGGRISTLAGENGQVLFCADAESTRVNLMNEDASGTNYIYILTDAEGIILSYSISGFDVANFEGSDFLIYGLAFAGNHKDEVGVNIADAILAENCHALTEQPLTIGNFEPQETFVALQSLQGELDICAATDEAVEIKVMNSGDQDAYFYLLTNEKNQLIAVFEDEVVTLNNGNGEKRIWGVSASGTITIKEGEVITDTKITDGCYELSTNFLTFSTTRLSSTKITSFQEEEAITICYGDGMPNYIGFTTMEETTDEYRFIMTDKNNVILRVMQSNIQNFEMAGPSVTRVWGVNYTGTLSVRPGQVLTDVMISDACYELSENFVEITRAQLDAGVISIKGVDEDLKLCSAVGVEQLYELSTSVEQAGRYSYIIVDMAGNVVDVVESSMIDFGAYSQSDLSVYGVAHVGDLSIKVGDAIEGANLAEGCYDLATNQLSIIRDVVDAGQVTTPDGQTAAFLCPEDDQPDIVVFVNNTDSRQNYQFVVTDEDNTVIGLPNAMLFDFTDYIGGSYKVWGLSYTGELSFEVGDLLVETATLSNGCFSLSKEYLAVEQATPVANQITTIDGEVSKVAYIKDGTPDLIEFTLPNSVGGMLLVITNTRNEVVGLSTDGTFDFDPFSVGFYRVHGVAYTGNVLLKLGDVYTGNNVSNGCYEVTQNFVQIICAPGNRGNRPNASSEVNPTTQLSPNPVATDFNLSFKQNTTGTTQISIFDAIGKRVYYNEFDSYQGVNQLNINVDDLRAAWYLLQIENAEGVQTIPFVKQ